MVDCGMWERRFVPRTADVNDIGDTFLFQKLRILRILLVSQVQEI